MKVVPTGDPSLYIAHTAAFVNFPDAASVKLRSAPDSLAIVLGRIWGLMDTSVEELLSQREQAEKDTADNTAADMAEALRTIDPNHPLVKKFDEAKIRSNGEELVSNVTQLLAKHGCSLGDAPRRGMVEHVTLLDRTSITSTKDVAAMLRRRNDLEGAKSIERAATLAREKMGINRVRVIDDFPLTLAAFGYTRLSRDPARAVLSSFPANERGHLPVYALSSETEALWFELSPLVVARWMQRNGLLSHENLETEQEAWAYLYAQVAGIRQSPTEPSYLERSAVAIRTLLHTMSHVFLRRIEWSGFAPSSVGEYMLPASLSFVLYANRYVETPIGGLTTLFEQRLETWLLDAVQSGRECVYDPICEDDGGSCAGCMHREHNCALFNRELSRATLYGGSLPQTSSIGAVRLTSGFWEAAITAAPDS